MPNTKKTMIYKAIAVIALLVFFTNHSAKASQGVSMPTCPLVGKIQNVEIRQEAGRGLSEGQTHRYLDVSVLITKNLLSPDSDDFKLCKNAPHTTEIFQMHATLLGLQDPNIPKIGSCFNGHSRFFADGNFMSGNWLTIAQALPHDACISHATTP